MTYENNTEPPRGESRGVNYFPAPGLARSPGYRALTGVELASLACNDIEPKLEGPSYRCSIANRELNVLRWSV